MTDTAISSVTSASGAYRLAKDLPATESVDATGADFGHLVREATQSVSEAMRHSDQVMQAGLRGEVGPQQVVEATVALETSVRTVVAVRDKLVEAYQEIMRMPI